VPAQASAVPSDFTTSSNPTVTVTNTVCGPGQVLVGGVCTKVKHK
jgi:hypothetical protein